jgi:hypothetical protein
MQDERNTPQDEDAEAVEAHHQRGPVQHQRDLSEEPGRSALNDDDDEVEAHHQRAPIEHQR